MYISSKKACAILGIHANTLRKWADDGKIRHIRSPSSNQRLYDVDHFLGGQKTRRKFVYCRVSSYKQKDDLERQVAYLKTRFPEHEIIEDIGSGLNFKRKGLTTLLESICSGDVEQVVVAHKDRLVRFGFELIQWLCAKYSTELVVLDQSSLSPTEELTRDLFYILHVFSRRVPGLRPYYNQVKTDKDLSHGTTESTSE